MKKIIFVLIGILGIVFFSMILFSNEKEEFEWDDTDYYTELNLKVGSDAFKEATSLLFLTDDMIQGKEVNFYLYEKDNRTEIHAIINGDGDNCSIHAREIELNQGMFQSVSYGGINLNSTTHTCTGDPCSSCRFRRNWFTGTINGCGCNNIGGHCNHSISTEVDVKKDD